MQMKNQRFLFPDQQRTAEDDPLGESGGFTRVANQAQPDPTFEIKSDPDPTVEKQPES